ncbi:VOC family protein [Arthrobacter sp. HLT1-21]
MYLENIVIDAAEPQRLGRFWEAALDGDRLTDEAGIFETRLSLDGGPALNLCFQRATELPAAEPRIHFDLLGAERQIDVVERLLGLGARHLDIGQIGVPWTVLADPEGNAFCVVNDRAAYLGTGPIAALLIDSADPDRDAQFWSWLTEWPQQARAPGILRHPSRRGPLLEFCPEPAPKGATKNQLHLDIRLEAGDDPDDVAAAITERGGHELHPAWGDLPWRIYADPSGNEFCVLPIRPGDTENPAMNEMGIDVRLVPPLDPATTRPDPRVRERPARTGPSSRVTTSNGTGTSTRVTRSEPICGFVTASRVLCQQSESRFQAPTTKHPGEGPFGERSREAKWSGTSGSTPQGPGEDSRSASNSTSTMGRWPSGAGTPRR